ncbi:unnamed protein product [Blepharisma stoltei]|uniref:Uncharacterized protein n=1 Tax=Blepharisma stoltei TaxID=1481888 RepID=A0AAU9J109_9CILI|nr:unnamed protein product [Blepharisma stoltei]
MPESAYQTTTVVFDRKILIAGLGFGNILEYDPAKNSYDTIFKIAKKKTKLLIVIQDQCYLLSIYFYSSEINNAKIWNCLGRIKNIPLYPISNICYYNNNILFFKISSLICKFDMENLEYRKIAATSDSLNFKDNLQINKSICILF